MKVAMLGVWHVHAKDYAACAKTAEGCELIGVYEENAEWRRAFAEKFGIAEFKTLEELLASEAEAVIVCAATDRHADLIVAAAEHGKHIFTEKVLALTVADCLRVRDTVQKAGVRFAISFPHKFRSGPLTVRRAVAAGEIGKVNYVRFRNCHSGSIDHWLPAHFYDLTACGGGAMIDLGAHGMYLLDWFLGAPETCVSAFTHACRDEKDALLNPEGIEDNAVSVLTFADGAIGVCETGFVSRGCPVMLEVGGDKGYIRYEAGAGIYKNTPETGGKFVPVESLPAEPSPIAQFLSGNDPAGCGIDEAIRLTRFMELAYKKQGGEFGA